MAFAVLCAIKGWQWMNHISPTAWTLEGLVGRQLCDNMISMLVGPAHAGCLACNRKLRNRPHVC